MIASVAFLYAKRGPRVFEELYAGAAMLALWARMRAFFGAYECR
jgi:hypothetical protein